MRSIEIPSKPRSSMLWMALRALSPWRTGLWILSSVSLALSVSLYGFLVGPLLRSTFEMGSQVTSWPTMVAPYLPDPPSLDQIRAIIPWLLVGAVSLKSLSFLSQKVQLAHITWSLGDRLRHIALKHLLASSVDRRHSIGMSDLHYGITRDIEYIERWIEYGLAPTLRDGLQVLCLGITAVIVGGEVGLFVLLFYPIIFWPIARIGRHLRRAAQEELSTASALSEWAHDALTHLPFTQAYQRDQLEINRLTQHQATLLEIGLKYARLQGIAPSFTELMTTLVIALSLSSFWRGIAQGRWMAEDLLGLFVCLIMMYQPLKSLSRAQSYWAQGQAAWRRLALWTDTPLVGSIDHDRFIDVEDTPLTHQLTQDPDPASLTLRDWCVYRGTRQVTPPIDLTIKAGQLLGVIGDNGAGKSSLVYSLLGLNPYRGGEAYIDSISFKDVPLSRWRAQWAWASQDAHLPPGTLTEILLQGSLLSPIKLKARLDEIIDVLQLRTLIERLGGWALPRRYESLSGGERQRLSLLRVFCMGRPLILLDEPEAHLDEQTLTALTAYLEHCKAKLTVLMITHDPTLISICSALYSLTPSPPCIDPSLSPQNQALISDDLESVRVE
jgi:ABC-type multidrug transport system fused ATPase/permease subunit